MGCRGKYSAEQWRRCEELVVEDGYTLQDAAKACEIAHGSVKRRAAEEQWLALRQGVLRYKPLMQRLRVEAIEAAIKEPVPERLSAWASVHKLCYKPTSRVGVREIVGVFEAFSGWVGQQPIQDFGDGFRRNLKAAILGYLSSIER